MDWSILTDKTMIGLALLHSFSKTKDCSVVMPENSVSKLNSLYKTWVICEVVTPKENVQNGKTPLQIDILVDPGNKLHFAVNMNLWGGIVKITFLNIRN